jgi:glycosyltransferase involved in cell wall biosynthesis
MAGLPAVATNVGQCSEVLDEGQAGILVPPNAPDQLAAALLALCQSAELRSTYSSLLQARIKAAYSPRRQLSRAFTTLIKQFLAPKRHNTAHETFARGSLKALKSSNVGPLWC